MPKTSITDTTAELIRTRTLKAVELILKKFDIDSERQLLIKIKSRPNTLAVIKNGGMPTHGFLYSLIHTFDVAPGFIYGVSDDAFTPEFQAMKKDVNWLKQQFTQLYEAINEENKKNAVSKIVSKRPKKQTKSKRK